MADRSFSPSPNKSQHLERGVFSSISSISLYKSVIEERKQLQSNSLIQVKSPKLKSPIRNRLMPSPRLTNRSKSPEIKSSSKPEEDPSKLQETVKKLSTQLLKEKKNNEKLTEQIKEITSAHKIELSNSLKNVEKLQKTVNTLKNSLTSLTNEKEQLVENLKKTSANLTTCQEEIKNLTGLFVKEIGKFCNNFSIEGKEKILKILRGSMNKLKIDLNGVISEVEKWKITEQNFEDDEIKGDLAYEVEYFDQGGDSLASTRGFNNLGIDDFQNAVALYDFEKERDEDLEFFKGDIIEILEKNESGWWIGRIEDRIGTFPFNFVNII